MMGKRWLFMAVFSRDRCPQDKGAASTAQNSTPDQEAPWKGQEMEQKR